MNLDVVSLGQRLVRLRELRGLSISAVAAEADMAKSYLAKLERGEVENPGLKTLDAIAHALNATLADLLAPSEVAGRDVEAGGESDVLDFEKLLASIPPELRQFLQEMEKGGERLPADIVRSLASIQFRGKRPKTVSDWRFVYDALSRSI